MGTDGRVAVAIGVAVAAVSAASSLPLTTSRRRRPRHQVFWCLAFVPLRGCLGSVGIKRRCAEKGGLPGAGCYARTLFYVNKKGLN
jgi:hypothetical protein